MPPASFWALYSFIVSSRCPPSAIPTSINHLAPASACRPAITGLARLSGPLPPGPRPSLRPHPTCQSFRPPFPPNLSSDSSRAQTTSLRHPNLTSTRTRQACRQPQHFRVPHLLLLGSNHEQERERERGRARRREGETKREGGRERRRKESERERERGERERERERDLFLLGSNQELPLPLQVCLALC